MKLIGIIRAAWESLGGAERAGVVLAWVTVGVVFVFDLAEGDVDLVRFAFAAAVAAVFAPFFVILGFRIKDWSWGGWE